MKGRQCAAFVAIIALLLGSFSGASAVPANPISGCPFDITAGGTYTLTNNIFASGDCITITQPFGDSVTINLNGFSIIGDGTGSAIFAPVPGEKISVVGPAGITGFFVGVDLGQTTDVTVKRLHVSFTGAGISVGQGSIYDSVVTDSDFGVAAGDKSTIKNVTATRNFIVGIAVGAGASVSQSTANNNGFGIFGGDKSLVKSSVANDNDFDGINVGISGTVTQSTANGNGFDGIFGDAKSNINKNTANNNDTGIEVNCPATVQQNTATNNGADIVLNGTGCTVKKNITTP